MLSNLTVIQWLFLALCFFLSVGAAVAERSAFVKAHQNLSAIGFIVILFLTVLSSFLYFGLPPILAIFSIWFGSYLPGRYYERIEKKAARALEATQITAAYEAIAEALTARQNEEETVTLEVTSWSQVALDAGLKYALDSGLTVIVEKHYRDNTSFLRLSGAIQPQILPMN